ncbi:hypothetical protein ES702_00898 [subsurface metagenome]
MSKLLKILILILLILLIALGGYLFYYYKKQTEPTSISEQLIFEQPTEEQQVTDQKSKNQKLTQIAQNYLKTKPEIYFENKFINWDDNDNLRQIDPNWFLTHEPDLIRFIEPNQYSGDSAYLNNKYAVHWKYRPGCEKDEFGQWHSLSGKSCISQYIFRVIIDTNFHIIRVEFDIIK